MFTLKRIWVLLITLLMIACNATQTVDWVEQIEKSDRKSSIKGMLDELKTFREHIEFLKDTKNDPSFNQIDILLKLDRSPVSETEEDHSATIFEPIEIARANQIEKEEEYLDSITEEDKDKPKPKSLLDARKEVYSKYREQTKMLLPFLEKQVNHKYDEYLKVLTATYYKGEPCRHLEIVNALSSIGSYIREKNPAEFNKHPSYANILKIFKDTLVNDIQQPPQSALIAANTLRRWKTAELIDTYEKLIKENKINVPEGARPASMHFDLRNSIIKLFSMFSTAKHKDTLLQILNTEPTHQPISYMKLVTEKLGDMKADEAIDRFIECLWLDDARGRNATAECRLALSKLDPKQVAQAALKTFKRQNAKVEERALRLNYAHTGLIEAKSAEILGDLIYVDALKYLIIALEREDMNPESFAADATQATFFTKGQVQKTISIAKTLAILGKAEGTKPLLNILKDEKKLFEYKLAASQQLSYLGSTAPIKDLMKIYGKKLKQYDIGNRDLKVQYAKTITRLITHNHRSFKAFNKGVAKDLEETSKFVKETEESIKKKQENVEKLTKEIDETKAKVKALKDKKVKLPPLPKKAKVEKGDLKDDEYKKKKEEASKAHEEALKKYQESLSKEQLELQKLENGVGEYQKFRKKVKNSIFTLERGLKIYQAWEKGFKEVEQQLKLVSSCKDSSNCWGNKLNDKASSVEIRRQAVYVLARASMKSKTSVEALLKRLKVEEDAGIRDVILFALNRHAPKDQASINSIKDAREQYDKKIQAGSGDKTLKNTIYSIDLLLAYLNH